MLLAWLLLAQVPATGTTTLGGTLSLDIRDTSAVAEAKPFTTSLGMGVRVLRFVPCGDRWEDRAAEGLFARPVCQLPPFPASIDLEDFSRTSLQTPLRNICGARAPCRYGWLLT